MIPCGRAVALILLQVPACDRPAPEAAAPRRDILATEQKLYSQGNEGLVIREFFEDRGRGFFLDVGAADPIQNSTTWYLEKHLGGSGIAIDALPYEPAYRQERPKTRFLQYIVTDRSGSIDDFWWVPVARELSSTTKDRVFDGQKLESREMRVPTVTLDDLLGRVGAGKIDFLPMDIEEGAPRALAAFDIARFAPELVCIEAGSDESYRASIQDYFARHGYVRIERYLEREPVNWYHRPRD